MDLKEQYEKLLRIQITLIIYSVMSFILMGMLLASYSKSQVEAK